jgi:hypothetical protein
MKKFGTPSGAAPGSAKLYVGFVSAGTPPAPRSAPVPVCEVVVLAPAAGFVEGCADFFGALFPLAAGFGFFGAGAAVLVVGLDGLDGLVELVVMVTEGVVTVGVVGVCVHDSLMPATATVTGSGIEESGVPLGTVTEKLSVWPVMSLTVITHASACAADTGTAASAATVAHAAISLIHSLRPVNTWCFSLAKSSRAAYHPRSVAGKLPDSPAAMQR